MNGLHTLDFDKLKNKENLTMARELKDFLQKDRKFKQARLLADQQKSTLATLAPVQDSSNDDDINTVRNGGNQRQSGSCQNNGNCNPGNNGNYKPGNSQCKGHQNGNNCNNNHRQYYQNGQTLWQLVLLFREP